VTEDEAFIRAVVDSPGDDTPRLVYADWLDDRGDPRGPYLRAEFEWAKPWRAGQRPADSPELRALAARLDPVWVARVSRPPVGVCCDHVLFDKRGDPVTKAAFLRLPKLIGIADDGYPFGYDYQAFLLNYNGGVPDLTQAGMVVVDRFYSLASSHRQQATDVCSIYRQHKADYLGRHYRVADNPWHWHYLPIATLRQGGHQLCIGMSKESSPRVFSLTHNTDYDPRNLTQVASTFAVFLSMLSKAAVRPESSQAGQ
jgi:uncharacterized protein (TIGR02996 family)